MDLPITGLGGSRAWHWGARVHDVVRPLEADYARLNHRPHLGLFELRPHLAAALATAKIAAIDQDVVHAHLDIPPTVEAIRQYWTPIRYARAR
jgi:hypothetical protein